jgi:hypothetical protein
MNPLRRATRGNLNRLAHKDIVGLTRAISGFLIRRGTVIGSTSGLCASFWRNGVPRFQMMLETPLLQIFLSNVKLFSARNLRLCPL